MNFWIGTILLVFVISLLLTGIIIPQILLIAFSRRLFDTPDGRKVHNDVVPRLGGASFLPSVFCSLTLVVGLMMRFGDPVFMESMIHTDIVTVLFAVCSIMMLYLVGMADDLVDVRYRAKFAVQIACAALTVVSGLVISDMHGFLWIENMHYWVSLLLTGFLVVYIINAINLIDGIDGLAAGLSVLALMFYGWLFYLGGEYIFSMISWATAGTLISFFYYNVFGKATKRNKIFMGDTGSLTVGFVLAFLSIEIMDMPVPAEMTGCNPFMMAFSPLLIPLFDVIRVCIHRFQLHRNPFLPDKSHIHHKLLAVGLSSGWALAVILIAAVCFVVFNVLLSPMVNINILLLIDILCWFVGNTWLTKRIHKREKSLGIKLYE